MAIIMLQMPVSVCANNDELEKLLKHGLSDWKSYTCGLSWINYFVWKLSDYCVSHTSVMFVSTAIFFNEQASL